MKKNYEDERDYVFNWLIKHNHNHEEWLKIIRLKDEWLLEDKNKSN